MVVVLLLDALGVLWIGSIGESALFSDAIVGWHGELAIDLADCTVLFLWVVNSKDTCVSILVINISGTPTIFDMS